VAPSFTTTSLPRNIIGVKPGGRSTPFQMSPSADMVRANSVSSCEDTASPASDCPGSRIDSPPGRSSCGTSTRLVTPGPASLWVLAKSIMGRSMKLAVNVRIFPHSTGSPMTALSSAKFTPGKAAINAAVRASRSVSSA
jgi:hypothetical protein